MRRRRDAQQVGCEVPRAPPLRVEDHLLGQVDREHLAVPLHEHDGQVPAAAAEVDRRPAAWQVRAEPLHEASVDDFSEPVVDGDDL